VHLGPEAALRCELNDRQLRVGREQTVVVAVFNQQSSMSCWVRGNGLVEASLAVVSGFGPARIDLPNALIWCRRVGAG